MLERVVERVQQAKLVDQVVIATPHPIPLQFEVPTFIYTGEEHNVVGRYYDCSKYYNATTVVRITSDCPLVSPSIIDECVHFRDMLQMDYVAAVEPNYPDGLDVEVFRFDVLKDANEKATSRPDREHVTPWMRRNAECQYYLDFWEGKMDKVSVDTEKDLERVRRIWNGKARQSYL